MTKSLKKAHAKTVKKAAAKSAIAKPKPDTELVSRPHTKQAILVGLLKCTKGATVDEMVEATGWQRHSVQGVMSGVLKKKLRLTITSDKEQRGRVYRIADAR